MPRTGHVDPAEGIDLPLAEEGTALLSNHRAVGRWDRTTLRFSKSLVLDQEKPAIGE
jgi:hypothetical protein